MSNIVMIEDDQSFATILCESLQEDAQLQVVACLGSQSEALQWMTAEKLKTIDCVLVDLMLPQGPSSREVNSVFGLQLVQALRQTFGFTGRIIVLTNSHDFSDGERALWAGCDAYMCKHAPPSKMDELLGELKLAVHGEVLVVPKEMRHVFLRDEVSIKEAKLMEMVCSEITWSEIAASLGYKNAKAAANIGYRVFDKILTEADKRSLDNSADAKRRLAIQRWRARTGRWHGH